MKPQLLYFICTLLMTFVMTTAALRFLIPKLKSLKMGQKILDVGPRWHKSKEGTPTMGGLSFLCTSAVVFAAVAVIMVLRGESVSLLKLIITFIMALLNGCVGIIDDYAKFTHKQNEGLSAPQKYLLQLLVAAAYLFAMRTAGFLTTALYIPFVGKSVELGWFYYVIALILITGIVNCVNLNDGIDGLASSVTLVVGGFFAVVSFPLGLLTETVLSALTVGSCLGFLMYNFYPARIFMGDTGSLFLGGMAVGMGFLIDNPLILLLAGIVYIIEGITVVMQVGYFKWTKRRYGEGRRLFRMSPIHHHFEKCGWREIKIVFVFSAFTLIACTAAYFGVGL